jgi:hypothetical protein
VFSTILTFGSSFALNAVLGRKIVMTEAGENVKQLMWWATCGQLFGMFISYKISEKYSSGYEPEKYTETLQTSISSGIFSGLGIIGFRITKLGIVSASNSDSNRFSDCYGDISTEKMPEFALGVLLGSVLMHFAVNTVTFLTKEGIVLVKNNVFSTVFDVVGSFIGEQYDELKKTFDSCESKSKNVECVNTPVEFHKENECIDYTKNDIAAKNSMELHEQTKEMGHKVLGFLPILEQDGESY